MNKREIGTQFEQMAADYMESCGMIILDRNYRCKAGEIDIVARDGDVLVFCEVKYRLDASFGVPEEAITMSKQRTIHRCAQCYMMQKHLSFDSTPCRFDAVAICAGNLRYYHNCF